MAKEARQRIDEASPTSPSTPVDLVPSPSPEGEPQQRHFLRACVALVFATIAFGAWMAWHWGGEKMVVYVSDAGTVSASCLACMACFRSGMRHTQRLRIFWWLLAAACGAWMSGEMIWTAYDLSGSQGPPVPSVADIGYLAFIPLSVVALLCHPGMSGRGVRKARALLDALAIAVAMLFLSWTSVLGPMWRTGDLTTLGGAVTLAYPVGDVVIAFCVLLALRRMSTPDRLELWCLLGGLIALALADSAYAYVAEVKHYTTGNLLDTGWFAGFLGIALGAHTSHLRTLPARGDTALATLPSLVAPLLPMFVALSAAGIRIHLGYRPDGLAVGLVIALVLLALVRQALLVVDFVTSGPGGDQGTFLDRLVRAVHGHETSD